MPYHTYEQIHVRMARRQSFQGNTMRAEAYPDGCGRISKGTGDERPPEDATYVVWSYDTPIAWVLANGDGYVVPQKFSVTTSGHQQACQQLYTEQQQDALLAERQAAWRRREEEQAERKRKREEKEAAKVARFVKRYYGVEVTC